MTPQTSPTGGTRGQLSFDFMVGMGVFLLSVGFAVGFLPGMFEPFTTDTGVNMVVADRSAALLSGSLLVNDSARPGLLNRTCTVEFFDADGDTRDCRFDDDADDLAGAIGADPLKNLNVTIEDDGEVVTLSGVDLSAGPQPGSKADLTVSRRVVFLDGTERLLYVRVW